MDPDGEGVISIAGLLIDEGFPEGHVPDVRDGFFRGIGTPATDVGGGPTIEREIELHASVE